MGNPEKIDVKGTSFDKYVISKPINDFSIIINRNSPFFNPSKNLNVSKITFEGCILKYPVCELPKFGLFKKFDSIKQHQFTLSIETQEATKLHDEQYQYDKISIINKKFNTNYFFQKNKIPGFTPRDLNYGQVNFYNPDKHYQELLGNKNYITIVNSYKDYLNFFYDHVVNSNTEIHLDIAFQMIEEWEDFYPILDMNIRSFHGAHDTDFDIGNIIKTDNFEPSAGLLFPRNQLVKK